MVRGLAFGILTSPQCPVEDLCNQPLLTVTVFVFSTTTTVFRFIFLNAQKGQPEKKEKEKKEYSIVQEDAAGCFVTCSVSRTETKASSLYGQESSDLSHFCFIISNSILGPYQDHRVSQISKYISNINTIKIHRP